MREIVRGPLPPTYVNELARLLNDGQLVVFVGAGLSYQATQKDGGSTKLPLWKELAERVASHCGYLSEKYDDLFDLFDAIAANMSRARLEEAVRHAIPAYAFDPSETHRELCRIGWHMVVTTNYDDLLDRLLNAHLPIVSEQHYDWLGRDELTRPKLVHLHGIFSDLHTLTGSDYVDWDEKHPMAYSFLQNIALCKTILFVGYSLSDPYLKLGLLPWLKNAVGPSGKRHYAWMWDAQQEQIKLLDQRNAISVTPIHNDSEWEASFRQLRETAERLRNPERSSKPKKVKKPESSHDPITEAVINGYKLYFYRNTTKLSIRSVSQKTGIDPGVINKLEQVRTRTAAGPDCFKTISREGLAAIERALDCIGKLEYGQADDFLAKFIMFYKVNRTVGRKKSHTKQLNFSPDTKAVVFDFGGTLTLTSSNRSTWERMWESVGYTSKDAGHYHRKYLSGAINHQEWCDITANELRKRRFSREHLQKIVATIKPIAGLEETISALRKQDTALYIVSGSVREIIVQVLGKCFTAFSDIRANEITFDDQGIMKRINLYCAPHWRRQPDSRRRTLGDRDWDVKISVCCLDRRIWRESGRFSVDSARTFGVRHARDAHPLGVLGWLFERQRCEDNSVLVLRVTGFADVEQIQLTP